MSCSALARVMQRMGRIISPESRNQETVSIRKGSKNHRKRNDEEYLT